MLRPPGLRVAPFVALGLLLLATLGGCNTANPSDSNPMGANPSQTARPSPLPYGYQEPERKVGQTRAKQEGEAIDEITAVVWGEVLTRRRLIRETRGPRPSEEDPTFERDLKRRRVEWAREQLMVKAAEMDGLRIVPSILDQYMEEEKARLVKEATKNTGQPVTFEQVLEQERISADEFRTRMKNTVLRQLYLRKLLAGLGKGARPQVDLAVSPAEVRRLYREQPELFDEQQGAAFVLFQLRTIDAMVGDVTPVEAEGLTARKAEEIAAAFRAGTPPRDIAQRFGLDERQWRESGQIAEKFQVPEGAAWLFDPQRKAGDAQVFTFEQVIGGPVVLGVTEVRAAQKRTFQESYDDVVKVYRVGRELRLENQRVIELVQGGSVVWPASLADEIVDDARERLRQLDADERLARARFR